MKITVVKNNDWFEQYTKINHKQTSFFRWDLFKLYFDMEKYFTVDSFDELKCVRHLPSINALPHQLHVARQVVFHMNGRAILADEVGLGKTIEAGLIIKEYMLRKLISSCLILAPASLVNQWANELQDKFQLPITIYQKHFIHLTNKIVIASIDTAKKYRNDDFFKQTKFDLVIVDEAHQLKNRRSINHQFVQQLQKKFCLLLTATPIQNKADELMALLSIIHPTMARGTDRKQTIKQFRPLIQQSVIRNRRATLQTSKPVRNVQSIVLSFSAEEQSIYDSLITAVKQHPTHVIRDHYLKAFCSSREACFLSLQNATSTFSEKTISIQNEIAQLGHHSKAQALLNLIQKHSGKKILIFTQYFASLYYLYHYLKQANLRVATLSGKLKHGQKQWITSLFAGDIDILIATEAAQEGVNMQFCHIVINYDLPWNPLKIEQRIGRVDRIGQKEAVLVFHLIMKGTIEEKMLQTLEDKIHIFEENIGELDEILTNKQVRDQNG